MVPFLSRDLTLQAQAAAGWGLSWLINPDSGSNGRGAGALAWAGLFNSYFWVDPAAMTAGVWATQLLPFEDLDALVVFRALWSAGSVARIARSSKLPVEAHSAGPLLWEHDFTIVRIRA